jgi:hypothetical protein
MWYQAPLSVRETRDREPGRLFFGNLAPNQRGARNSEQKTMTGLARRRLVALDSAVLSFCPSFFCQTSFSSCCNPKLRGCHCRDCGTSLPFRRRWQRLPREVSSASAVRIRTGSQETNEKSPVFQGLLKWENEILRQNSKRTTKPPPARNSERGVRSEELGSGGVSALDAGSVHHGGMVSDRTSATVTRRLLGILRSALRVPCWGVLSHTIFRISGSAAIRTSPNPLFLRGFES